MQHDEESNNNNKTLLGPEKHPLIVSSILIDFCTRPHGHNVWILWELWKFVTILSRSGFRMNFLFTFCHEQDIGISIVITYMAGMYD